MNEQILVNIEEVWRQHRASLEEALTEAIDALQNLLRLDEHLRHGHDTEQLERALGPLASGNLDLSSLSRLLGQSTRSRVMAPDRIEFPLTDLFGNRVVYDRRSGSQRRRSTATLDDLAILLFQIFSIENTPK